MISGSSERGTSGWITGCGVNVVSLRTWSKLASMCFRESRAETGLSWRSLVAKGDKEGGREGARNEK